MTITIPTISALPTAPSRTDPSTFASRGDAFVAALATLRTEMNTTTAAIKTEVEAEVNGLAPLASPVFTGNPTAPTPATADNDTSIATTAMVQARVAQAEALRWSGSMVMLNDTGITGTPTAVDFVHGVGGVVLSATYDEILLTLTAVKPTTTGANLLMRTSTNGGSTYDAGVSDYQIGGIQCTGGTNTALNGGSTAIALAASVGNSGGSWEGVSGWVRIWRPSAALPFAVQWHLIHRADATGGVVMTTAGAFRLTNTDVDALRFLWSTGTTFATGRIKMFGRVL